MPEANGNSVNVGDTILVQSQVAKIERYDEGADRFAYRLGEGHGTNIVEAHISNTHFRVIDLSGSVGLAHEQNDKLEELRAEVKMIADPQEEDPDTDRVKGDLGAKFLGNPVGEPEGRNQKDQFTTTETLTGASGE